LQAFRWTSGSGMVGLGDIAGGMQALFDVLVANGVAAVTGWTLVEATGVSADGAWVTGYGINPMGQTEAFVLRCRCYGFGNSNTAVFFGPGCRGWRLSKP